MVWDLEKTLEMGFNMVRKHIKIGEWGNRCVIISWENTCVESERWYYWTDKMGLLVWQDFPSISNMAKIKKEDKENFAREYTK